MKNDENRKLKQILTDLFETVDMIIAIFRAILYVGSVLAAWYYFEEKVAAIAIISSLTVAHVLIEFKEYISRKKSDLLKC